MIVHNDELGRAWIQYNTDTKQPPAQAAIGILAALDDDDRLKILGNIFVVHSTGSRAICFTAAHSFDAVAYQQTRRSGRNRLPLAPDLQTDQSNYINANEIFALFFFDDQMKQCAIEQLNYIEHYDVAVCTVAAPETHTFSTAHFAIDLAAPNVGDAIGVIANHISTEPTESYDKVKLTHRLMMRGGVVTEVTWDFSPVPGQSFFFETTIPFLGGMSGAPIFSMPAEGECLKVCGVVSSDLSTPEAHRNMMAPGESKVSMLWPAMGLGLNLSLGSGQGGHMLLGELLARGGFDNRTEDVEVLVVGNKEKTLTTYIDRRVVPEFGIELETKAHPNFSNGDARD